jgi:alpha-2-macroglobulin
MPTVRLALLFVALNIVAPAGGPLRVIRATPETPASPDAEITVTFDRPVAGGLDEAVPAGTTFRISPAVEGRIEWRDPLTLRFQPASPLQPGATYTITVLSNFHAMDGSSLDGDYVHSFRVSPPSVLGGDPANQGTTAANLPAQPVFRLLVSAPVDLDRFGEAAHIQLSRACGSASVRMRGLTQHPIGPTDPGWFRYTGLRGPRPEPERDLRRVVEITPAEPLPLDCDGVLTMPVAYAEPAAATLRWAVRTYGPFRVTVARCAFDRFCPTGPVRLVFSTPVSGEEVVRNVKLLPATPYTLRDTATVSTEWILDARLDPRRSWAVVVASDMRDIFEQTLQGRTVQPFRTTGWAADVKYDYGRMLVEREGLRTLAVQHMNVDSLHTTIVAVPDTMEREFLSRDWNWEEPWAALAGTAVHSTIAVTGATDERRVTGLRLNQGTAGPGGTLFAVKVSHPSLDSVSRGNRPIALVQVTNLGVHARIAVDQGTVWVTGVNDGLPRSGVDIELHDPSGRVRATGRTDALGLAELNFRNSAGNTDSQECEECIGGFEGYIAARTSSDRALVGINAWDPDLAPWRFGMWGAWERDREPAAAAVFTERGIYRPGEAVHAKAIVRKGTLGSLRAAAGDSLRWTFHDREGGTLRDTTVRLGPFGTADARLELSTDLPLGWYGVEIASKVNGEWKSLDRYNYQVAEYRPPEFLVDATAHDGQTMAGDTATLTVSARYLFGAPMANSPVDWVVRIASRPWGVAVKGAEGYTVGAAVNWWENNGANTPAVTRRGVDTLDATGQREIRVLAETAGDGRPATATLVATVTDANRQTASASATVTVHPTSFYIGAKPRGEQWFWTAGRPVTVDVITITPAGERVTGIDVDGTIVRREWHRVRRTRDGQVETVAGWVSDTVATCAVRTDAEPAPCTFTPPSGGSYTVSFQAKDERGRTALTSLARWAQGSDFVPWSDESQLKMDVVTDRPTYDVGDTATVFFAAPFTDAEAWITIERERVFESRRIRLTSGATTLRLPITEAYTPNIYVSIVVARGRSAPPGPLDDPGRPTIRVGYAQLHVVPSVKRLAVTVEPLAVGEPLSTGAPASTAETASPAAPRGRGPTVEYGPGDTASVRVGVRDSGGRGRRAEVTLWAVDEGVLALTGYTTPDPISLIYRERGLGVRLASNLVSVAAQIPDGQKGRREAGGGGGDELAGVLRSQFRSTAFFLGSVVTDAEGNAVARAKLPDNLTTFRVMAVAVTEEDRYGSGESSILVTRPLLARPALPRFVRATDRFAAGVVVNQRAGGTPKVEVEAKATGIRIEGSGRKTETLAAGRGAEVRFDFRATPGDSAYFQFAVKSGSDRDAVRLGIPVRPDYHPLASTIAGVVEDTTSAVFVLRDDVDPSRSTLDLSFGSSVFAVIDGTRRHLHIYPYYCSEQVSSIALPLVALYRARVQLGMETEAATIEADVRSAVRTLSRRQGANGGIGYWSASDWTSPWLSAYAGRVLLEAKAAGIAVDSTVLSRIADYLRSSLNADDWMRIPVNWYYTDVPRRLSEKVAAADYLSRYGQPHVATENTLLQQAARLRWEDRVALAELLGRRNETRPALALLDEALAGVRIEGRRATLPAAATDTHYFRSEARPAARLLSATLELRPDHPAIGPLVESLVDRGRENRGWGWNTQDYGWSVLALAEFERARSTAGESHVTLSANRRTITQATVGSGQRQTALADTTVPIDRLVTRDAQGRSIIRLDVATTGVAGQRGLPVWFFATVNEVPKTRPVDPVDRGLVVERWYEDIDTKRPVTTVVEGELVRVRLRLTVPDERHFVVLDDPLPAGLEPVDLSLRTVAPLGATFPEFRPEYTSWPEGGGWWYGSWDSGIWSAFDHRELRDDRVVYSATMLWKGAYTATYIARATTAGTFVVPPAHAEEMYNPGVNGRTGGTSFTVKRSAN